MQTLHSSRYSFFQSEIDLRLYSQIDSGIKHNGVLYIDVVIPFSPKNLTDFSKVSGYPNESSRVRKGI